MLDVLSLEHEQLGCSELWMSSDTNSSWNAAAVTDMHHRFYTMNNTLGGYKSTSDPFSGHWKLMQGKINDITRSYYNAWMTVASNHIII